MREGWKGSREGRTQGRERGEEAGAKAEWKQGRRESATEGTGVVASLRLAERKPGPAWPRDPDFIQSGSYAVHGQ